MKKLVYCLLIFAILVILITQVSCGSTRTTEPEEIGIEVEKVTSVLSLSGGGGTVVAMSETIFDDSPPKVYGPTIPSAEVEEVTPELEEEDTDEGLWLLSDDIPLSYDDQKSLQAACDEFDVPYALALGLIEKETNFRNIVGDDGASTGYMQIQKKWHYDRMERLGVTDLSDPSGNFRVGCNYLSECRDIYGDWDLAVTVYNYGHNPGYITNYAYAVMDNYEKWLVVVGADY